jgi:hypothetical protein
VKYEINTEIQELIDSINSSRLPKN